MGPIDAWNVPLLWRGVQLEGFINAKRLVLGEGVI